MDGLGAGLRRDRASSHSLSFPGAAIGCRAAQTSLCGFDLGSDLLPMLAIGHRQIVLRLKIHPELPAKFE
jgi:hypothetical protein